MRLLFCALIPECSNTFLEKAFIILYNNYKCFVSETQNLVGFRLFFSKIY